MNTRPTILVLDANEPSTRCVIAAGGRTLTVSPTNTKAVMSALDTDDLAGLLLTGGGDVDPRRYGQKPSAEVYGVNETRDRNELVALGEARDRGLPVMGICRGSQIMNVEAGGTLTQHVGGHYGWHAVRAVEGSLLRAAFIKPTATARSLHHQVVRQLAPGFNVTGFGMDGMPEAIESDDGRCLGVQFHPEHDPNGLYARRLFHWLVASAADRTGLKPPTAPTAKKPVKKAKPSGPVKVSYFCGQCRGVTFDDRQDYTDHQLLLHGVQVA